MTDFALRYVSRWRDGEMPKPKDATHVVRHDTHNLAYKIHADEVGDFHEWVAYNFAGENDPWFGVDFVGSVREYLDDIGVTIEEVSNDA